MSKKEVVLIGAAIADLQLQPTPADVLQRDITFLDQFAFSIGGDAVNEATVISRLGHQTSLMAIVGDDAPGKFVLNHCKANNIDTSAFTTRKDINTSINVALISDSGASCCISPRNSTLWQLALEDVKLETLDQGYKILSFASLFSYDKVDCDIDKIFKRAKENGMIICADVQNRLEHGGTFETVKAATAYVDYIFPNYREARWLTGKDDPDEMADELLSWGIKHVIIKLGSKGCLLKSATERYELPCYPVTCIDETGAGDNFAGGFISALLEGKSFKECGQFATAVASIAVEHVGAATGVKTRSQVDERLKQYLEFIGE